MLTQESVAEQIPITMRKVVYDELAQAFEALSDVLIGKHSRNEESEGVKEETGRLLEEIRSYKLEKTKLEKRLLENRLAIKTMNGPPVDLESFGSRLEKARSLLINT